MPGLQRAHRGLQRVAERIERYRGAFRRLAQLLLQGHGAFAECPRATEAAGGAQPVQPFDEGIAIRGELGQVALQRQQLVAQQPAQGFHGDGVSTAAERGGVVEQRKAAAASAELQDAAETVKVAGLEQDVAEPGVEQALSPGHARLGAAGHGRREVGGGHPVATQGRQHLQCTGTGHAAIQQQQVEAFASCPLERGGAINAGLHIRAKMAQPVAQKASAGGVVVGHQDAGRGKSLSRRVVAWWHDEILVVQLTLAEWRGMRLISSRLLLCIFLLGGFAWGVPARADVVIAAKQIRVAGVSMQDVTSRLSAGLEPGTVQLNLHAAKADISALGWHRVGLTLDGTLQRDAGMRWLFSGSTQVSGAPGRALAHAAVALVVDASSNTLQVDLGQDKTQVDAALPLDQTTHAQINVKQLPASWLQGLLGTVWSGRITGGRMDAQLALDARDGGIQASGDFILSRVGFDTPAGTLAGQGLNGQGRLGIDTTGKPSRIDFDGSLRDGQLLLGSIFANLPDHPVQLGLGAEISHGAVAFSRLRVSDPDALQLDGSLAFDARGRLQRLRLDRFHASFPLAYQRYGQAWLNTLGLQNLQVAGQLDGRLDLRPAGWRSFSFHTDGLDIADGAGRLSVVDLRGGLDWAAQGDRPATTLGWDSLKLYRIDNGAAVSHWRSRSGSLTLQQPLLVPVLGGQLRVAALDWRPAAAKGQRLSTSLILTGVDMGAFSKAMGWPQFPGTLGGAIPSLRWMKDRIVLDGGLSLNVFGGFVDITRMTLQQPFGVSPVLSGDVNLRQIDLGALTSVFDFGRITGRMNGSIDGLRLVDWTPVAFKASLLAGGGGRISQRAVNNLTAVGGGGMAGGLQGAVLRIFKNFDYKRIGLNCTLQANVCQMGGLDSSAGGYTIVEGSGLPHLQVIGHQTRVDWPTLVRRLKAAIHGSGPEIR